MTLPTVHNNGTSRKMLADSYEKAFRATLKAMDAFHEVEFNGRDYYTQEAGAMDAANEQRRVQAQALDGVKKYLEAHLEHLGV